MFGNKGDTLATDDKSDAEQFAAWRAEQNKTDADRQAEQDKLDELQKSQTVRFTFQTASGNQVHLCGDGEFRTTEELNSLGVEDE